MPATRFRLERPPLVFVLAQLVFPPVKALPLHIESVQEALRALGYVRFQSRKVGQISFNPATNETEVSESPLYQLGTKDRTLGLTLSENSFALQTTKYQGFDSFASELRAVSEPIASELKLPFTARRGLRYVNVIRTTFAGAKDYLDSSMLGLPVHRIEGDLEAIERTSVLLDRTRSGDFLLTKVLQNCVGRYLPPDLAPGDVSFDDAKERGLIPSTDEQVVLLDLDHFSGSEQVFDLDSLMSNFGHLHDRLESRFESIVTALAKERWGYTTDREGG